MCGISGIYHLDGRPIDQGILEVMSRTMTHRGPDGEGYYVNAGSGERGNIGLGHRRLSIIDLATGKQPLCNEDGSVWITFNGEIYNFPELKTELEKKGHRFKTRSDTETIIHAHEEWGDDAVKRLRGMFAYAIWDERRKKLVLVRDRVGKKPLYYLQDGKRLAFASELKALLKLANVDRSIDFHALDAYLSYGYVPSPFSIFQGIRKLPPAHMAVFAEGRLNIKQYWHLDMTPSADIPSEEEAAEGLLEIFDEAVRIRLMSEVPLGAFLSGGVDSSAVVAAMAGMMNGNPVKTASIGFYEKKFGEQEYARIVAEQYLTDHTEFVVEPDALSILDKLVWHFDEPFADSSAIPTYYVCKMARENVTVALSGDGGDETFAGYANRYYMTHMENRIRSRIPPQVRNGVLAPMAAIYPRIDSLPRPLRLKAFLSSISSSFENAYIRAMSFYFLPEMKEKLYSKDLKAKVGGFDAGEILGRHFSRTNPDAVSRAQYVDINTYLPEDILVKVDRMSMAHSLEVRSPILDHKLMEYAGKLPSRLKLNGRETKYIFKKINEHRLPKEILYRKKQGFCVPLADWLRGELKGFARETLFSTESGLKEYFAIPYVQGLWEMHQSGGQDNAAPLWGLMMFELWRKQYA